MNPSLERLLCAAFAIALAFVVPASADSLGPPIYHHFFGSATTDGGKTNIAWHGYDSDTGFPRPHVEFDDRAISGASVPLSSFPDSSTSDVGRVNTSLGAGTLFNSGGDGLLFLDSKDSDDLIVKQSGTSLKGVHNVSDLLDGPNVNLLAPGADKRIFMNFVDGPDLSNHTFKSFGTTASVGAYLSTTSAVTLDIFDISGKLLDSLTETPSTMDPFFLGIVIVDSNNSPVSTISTARFTFSGSGALDGAVIRTVQDNVAPLGLGVPEPAGFFLLGTVLLGTAQLARRRRRNHAR